MASASASPLKILVVGDVGGQVGPLYKKVGALLKKNEFNALLCVGSFFGLDGSYDSEMADLLAGKKKAPLPTYILGANLPSQTQRFASVPLGGDLCENISYLGHHGIMTIAGGLRVAYLSGVHDHAVYNTEGLDGENRPYFTQGDVDELVAASQKPGFPGVDILLTSVQPEGIYRGIALGAQAPPAGSPGVSSVAKALIPRYHLASGAFFHERLPYRNHTSDTQQPLNVTRFISLAAVNSPTEKWIYAFNIVPRDKCDLATVTQQPPNATALPYGDMSAKRKSEFDSFFYGQQNGEKKARKDASVPPDSYVCRKCNVPGHFIKDCPEMASNKHGASGAPPPEYVCHKCSVAGHWIQDCPVLKDEQAARAAVRPAGVLAQAAPAAPCWFCLGSPQVEKHLVVSVGQSVYLALPKGGLNDGHILILPIQHTMATVELDEATAREIARYKESLREYFASQGQVCIIFERNFKSQHLQLQVVPIPSECMDRAQEAFQAVGARYGVDFQAHPLGTSISNLIRQNTPYFAAELPTGEMLFHEIKNKNFPLQLGREVAASDLLLNTPERVDWKACSASKEEETAAASAYRKAFKPFDFNFKK